MAISPTTIHWRSRVFLLCEVALCLFPSTLYLGGLTPLALSQGGALLLSGAWARQLNLAPYVLACLFCPIAGLLGLIGLWSVGYGRWQRGAYEPSHKEKLFMLLGCIALIAILVVNPSFLDSSARYYL